MANEQMSNFQSMVIALKRVSTELEDMFIENQVYREFIGIVSDATPEFLDEIRDKALSDPERRAQARAIFADMQKALMDAGTSAGFEEILNNLPPTGKPQ